VAVTKPDNSLPAYCVCAHILSLPVTLLTIMIINIWRDPSWTTEPYIWKHGKTLWNLKEKKKRWCQIAKTNYMVFLCYVNRTKTSAINSARSYCTVTFLPDRCKIKITVIHRYILIANIAMIFKVCCFKLSTLYLSLKYQQLV
jgi:hypothetical protein